MAVRSVIKISLLIINLAEIIHINFDEFYNLPRAKYNIKRMNYLNATAAHVITLQHASKIFGLEATERDEKPI